jgi:hypothetical protein
LQVRDKGIDRLSTRNGSAQPSPSSKSTVFHTGEAALSRTWATHILIAALAARLGPATGRGRRRRSRAWR